MQFISVPSPAQIRSVKAARALYHFIMRPMRSEQGDYDYLRWNSILEWIWRLGSPRVKAFLTRMILTSSPHYLYPQNQLYFVPGEYEEKLAHMRTSRDEIASQVLSKLVKADDTVLEFGCGPGLIVGAIARYCQHAIGIDVSQPILKVAEFLHHDIANVSFQRSSGLDLKAIPDQSTRFIYSIECIQHIDKVHSVTFFHEFYRILQPGGRMLIHFPDLTHPHELDAWWEGTWKTQSQRPYSDLTMMRIRYYVPEELRLILTRIGFQEIQFLNAELQPVERASTYVLAIR